MSAARRSRRKRDWPRGLYEPRPGYYYWRHPDGTPHTLGKVPLAEALNQAILANLHLLAARPTLVQRLTGAAKTVADLLDKMPTAGRPNTVKTRRSQDKLIREFVGEDGIAMGARHCGHLKVAHISELLEAIKAKGQARQAEAVRSRLTAVCRKGMALGWMDSNPAEVTEKPVVTVKRRRLTLETFKKIYAAAADVAPWLQRAMRIALVLGTDVSTTADLARAMVAGDAITFQRGKTDVMIEVPLDLTLNVMEWRLRDILAERTGVLSKYFLHHLSPYGNAPVGSKIHPNRLSRKFTEARVAAGIPDEGAPTFHEMRSLCKRLYNEQGNVDTKALLGHKTDRMGALYENPRGAEAVRVRISK